MITIEQIFDYHETFDPAEFSGAKLQLVLQKHPDVIQQSVSVTIENNQIQVKCSLHQLIQFQKDGELSADELLLVSDELQDAFHAELIRHHDDDTYYLIDEQHDENETEMDF